MEEDGVQDKDSIPEPTAVDESIDLDISSTTGAPTLWTQRLAVILAALVSGGILTATVTYLTAGEQVSIQERDLELREAIVDPQLLVTYWVGMPPHERTTCRDLDLEDERCSVPEGFDSYAHTSLANTEPNMFSLELFLNAGVDCFSRNCDALVARDDGGCGRGAVWLVIENVGGSPARSVEIQLKSGSSSPIEIAGSFDFLDFHSNSSQSYALGDLVQDEGVMVALGVVWVCQKGPASFVPIGDYFSPERLYFVGRIEEQAVTVREPADLPTVVSGDSYWRYTGG